MSDDDSTLGLPVCPAERVAKIMHRYETICEARSLGILSEESYRKLRDMLVRELEVPLDGN